MINLFSKSSLSRIVLPLFLIWLIACGIIIYRLNHYGAFASLSATKTLSYLKEVANARPETVRLNQSYDQWALALNLTDASNYIKIGLGFADGKGVSLKNISPENPNSHQYLANYFQSPGTSIVIGSMVKLFGEGSVLPYFILIAIAHFVTALLTCFLASYYIEGDGYIFGVGLLGLLSLPVLDFNFGLGVFSSEPLSKLCLVCSLISLSDFWKKLSTAPLNYRQVLLIAFCFGTSMTMASYFRGIYTTFARFCWYVLGIVGLFSPGKRKQIFLFILISFTTLSALQDPWMKRNKHYFGEYTMAGSSYHGYTMWHDMWDNNRESSKWGWNAGHGLGNYLAPEKSAEVSARLNKNKEEGSRFAFVSLIAAVMNKPWQALEFKSRVYDVLWFGQRCNFYIYAWCVVSTVLFFVFLFLNRFRFLPALYLFPMFLLSLSPFIHYEHRYSQPFFFFITPIATMCVLKYFLTKNKLVNSKSIKESELVSTSQ